MTKFENLGRVDADSQARMECGVCWTVDDPAEGDSRGRAEPGTLALFGVKYVIADAPLAAPFRLEMSEKTSDAETLHLYEVPNANLGDYSPTEIVRAWQLGASVVKVFPVGSVGPRYLRDVLAPLTQIPLLPTGGVTLDNAADFIKAGARALGLHATPGLIQRRPHATSTQHSTRDHWTQRPRRSRGDDR